MENNKFDSKKLKKLNNPDRLKDIPPKLVWDKLNLKYSNILVDIGAGTGFYSIPFLELSENGKIFACDISDVMINWMIENICVNYPKIIPTKMEENNIDLPDNTADLVFMINLHHELQDSSLLLNECFRLLKPTGKILIIDWKKEDMPSGPPTEIRCSIEQVKKELEKAKYKNMESLSGLEKHFMIIAEK